MFIFLVIEILRVVGLFEKRNESRFRKAKPKYLELFLRLFANCNWFWKHGAKKILKTKFTQKPQYIQQYIQTSMHIAQCIQHNSNKSWFLGFKKLSKIKKYPFFLNYCLNEYLRPWLFVKVYKISIVGFT